MNELARAICATNKLYRECQYLGNASATLYKSQIAKDAQQLGSALNACQTIQLTLKVSVFVHLDIQLIKIAAATAILRQLQFTGRTAKLAQDKTALLAELGSD